jgi:hypothetical protein
VATAGLRATAPSILSRALGSDDALPLAVRRARVSSDSDVPERPPGGGLVAALDVRHNALVGAAVGLGLAVVVYLVRVFELLGPVGGGRSYPVVGEAGWFAVLGFVLAVTTALLVTTLLTALRAYRLATAE